MPPPIYSTTDPARRLDAQRWYHGPISYATAAGIVRANTFLVRQRVEHVWYQLLTPDLVEEIRRPPSRGGYAYRGSLHVSVIDAVRAFASSHPSLTPCSRAPI